MAIKSTDSQGSNGISYVERPKPICHYKGCTKSLKLVDQALKCRCDGVFCRKHRDVVAHHCKKDAPLNVVAKKTKHVFEKANQEGSAF